jgi:hypothetical protein
MNLSLWENETAKILMRGVDMHGEFLTASVIKFRGMGGGEGLSCGKL